MIDESSVDRGHVLDKLGVVPLSTKPLHAQERMASEADRRGRIVRHTEIAHGDSTDGIVPPPAKQVKTGMSAGARGQGELAPSVTVSSPSPTPSPV